MLGLLLLNVGTPDAPTPRAVRRYLREFLSDPRVLDVNPVLRFLLLNLVILPFRPSRSAKAYREIWTPEGSPLLSHGLGLAQAVQMELGPNWIVRLAMRYGNPSVRSGLLAMAAAQRIVVLPLFPQYSSASTGSALAHVYREAAKHLVTPNLSVIPPFFQQAEFLNCVVVRAEQAIRAHKPRHILFSYHGLPTRQVKRCDPSGRCCLQKEDCCEKLGEENKNCYRAQCYFTTSELAKRLQLEDGSYTTCFQSRLGKTPWIEPDTVQVMARLAAQNVKRLVVLCPAFVADCLETTEEIGLRLREAFLARGGEEFALVPSLNADADWALAVAGFVRSHAEQRPARQNGDLAV